MHLKNAIHASTYIRGYPMPILYIADVERDVAMKKLSPKEAARVLEDMKVKIEIPKAAVTQWKRNTALDMAIEALKYSEIPNSSDTIIRPAAIDALDNAAECWNIAEPYHEGMRAGFRNSANLILSLPSVQPEIIRCKGCKYACIDPERESDEIYCSENDFWKDDDFYCGFAERRAE